MFAVAFRCFASILDVCCKCFSCSGRMLLVFHLGVAKVDLMLHILQWDPPVVAPGAPPSGRVQAREKPSAGVRAHAVGRAKNRRYKLHFSCA